MAIEPMITAVLTKAAGDLLSKVIDRWWPSGVKKEEISADQDASSIMSKPGVYDALRRGLTDNCVHVLKFLEDGENRSVHQIREHLHPNLKFSAKAIREFDGEFYYRLEYLLNLGLLARAGSEYAMSRLGWAFVQEARSKKDYYKVFFP